MRILICAIGLLAAGCSGGSMSQEEYAKASLAISQGFFDVGRQIESAPLPPQRKDLPREQRYEIIGEHVQKDAARYDVLVHRAKALRPPPEFKEHHRALVALVEGTRDGMRSWGAELKTADRARADAASDRLYSQMADSMKKLISSIEGMKGSDFVQKQFGQMKAEMGKLGDR